jgi:hypothetical protein
MNFITLYEKSPLRMEYCPETRAFSVWHTEKVLITTTKAELADAYFTQCEEEHISGDLVGAMFGN